MVPRSTFVPTATPQPPNVQGPYGGGAFGPQRPAFAANAYPAAGVPAAYGGNLNQPVYYGAARPVNGLGNQMAIAAAEGIAGGVAQAATQALFQGIFGGGLSGDCGGGGASGLDVVGMDGGGATVIDGGSFFDGGYGGADEGV